jgi:hypothetical protein
MSVEPAFNTVVLLTCECMPYTMSCGNAMMEQRGDVSAADEEQECIALHRGSAILAVMTAHPLDARTQVTSHT